MAVAGCHVMAKPGGAICNIDCTYCFYLEKEALYPERNKNWRMSDETLEQFIRQHIAAQSGDLAGRRTDHDGATVFPPGCRIM